MSTLTNALERIMNWLQQYAPEYAASFLPGLTYEEIEENVKELPLRLPLEIYELYQWRNGSTSELPALFFAPTYFLSLEQAIQESFKISISLPQEEGGAWYEGKPLFLFLVDNSDYCAVCLDEEQYPNSPVVDISKGYKPQLFYTSLTSMMQTLAECYETGAFYFDAEGYLCEDEQASAPILRKYNPEIVETALAQLRSLLPVQSELSQEVVSSLIDEILVMARFKDPRSVTLLIEALQTHWAEPRPQSRVIRSYTVIALGRMGDTESLESLVFALKNDFPEIRKNAAGALGDLRDSRAIEPLIEALDDEESDVGMSARLSLFYLKAVEQMIQLLQSHETPQKREGAAWVLGKTKDVRAIEPLTQLLEDGNIAVRFAAQNALKEINATLVAD